jgi:hypothetical protein
MQRKQQVGECWVCVIFFACVCVGVSDYDNWLTSPLNSFWAFLLFLADFSIFSGFLN